MVFGCLGIGNMFQSNQAAAIFIDITGADASVFAGRGWLIGLLLAGIVALVIIGGIRSIARTTVRLVPTMALLYVTLALLTIALNADRLPAAIAAIWNGAFTTQGMAGGGLGALVIGFRRAVFSNEAGLGSAAIAHATARTAQPASEGFVALLEPFIDTVVICTLSALVITTTVYDPALATGDISGIELTTRAFASTLPWSPIPLAAAAIMFRFLDDDRLGLLRPEGLHVPGGGRTTPAPRLQPRLLRVRRRRGEPESRGPSSTCPTPWSSWSPSRT